MDSSDSKEPSSDEQSVDLEKAMEIAREAFRKVNAEGTYFTIGEVSGNVNIGNNFTDSSVDQARQIFVDSLRKRNDFMSTVLNQALRQANVTFNLSIYFMILGGLIVLAAAILAISRFAGSPSHGIALVSGVGGLLIGTSGAAFSHRADKARKHLAQQAEMMQSQLLGEQKFSQVIDLLTGIRDDKLNDQARITLAARLMGELNENSGTSFDVAVSEPKKRRGAN